MSDWGAKERERPEHDELRYWLGDVWKTNQMASVERHWSFMAKSLEFGKSLDSWLSHETMDLGFLVCQMGRRVLATPLGCGQGG